MRRGDADNCAVIGSGSIGVSWSIVFARAGHRVTLHDTDPGRLDAAGDEVDKRLTDLVGAGLLQEDASTVAARVSRSTDLAETVSGAIHVQEAIPEDLILKRALFDQIAALVAPDAILASSTSALMASMIFKDLSSRDRCLVVHPANPPHLLPVVELVPAPFTRPDVVDRTDAFLRSADMSPIRVRTEVEGFVLNRLQGAVLREAYCLVRDGVANVDEIDRVVRDGLGRRWAIVGPFETSDLNTRGGIEVHAGRMGPAYARMGAERGQDDPWTPGLVAEVTAQRRALLPLDQWEQRVAWRDERLLAHERTRREVAS